MKANKARNEYEPKSLLKSLLRLRNLFKKACFELLIVNVDQWQVKCDSRTGNDETYN